jgi:EAL domain-containing protein (putative c-di-GMP-specific phosphodiesterase class I)/CheY-like chemotaxis protein
MVAEAAAARETEGPRARVLVADDDPAVRRYLKAMIDVRDDLEVVAVAGDGEQAVHLAAMHQPDVALVDVRMPRGGGREAVRGIRRSSPETLVLIYSDHADQRTVVEMFQAGAHGFVAKGASGDDLIEALVRTLAGERVTSAQVASSIVDELSRRLSHDEARAMSNRRVVDQIRQVIDDSCLEFVFQPIADLASSRVVGVEALSRFPVAPMRPPARWFEEAWAVGLGVELELAALEGALEASSRLPSGIFLAVNLSPATLSSERLREILAVARRRRLVVEVTEHAPVDDYAALREALAFVRGVGGWVAVDDVGAGYSSLQHILEISPDAIKLDLGITRDVHIDAGRRSLASAFTRFAADMGVMIMAEGIETAEELAALRELGIEYGQGFFLAPPRPLDAVDLTEVKHIASSR